MTAARSYIIFWVIYLVSWVAWLLLGGQGLFYVLIGIGAVYWVIWLALLAGMLWENRKYMTWRAAAVASVFAFLWPIIVIPDKWK